MKGKIVLLPFPFTDLSTAKRRPALVILERTQDVVVVFISSKVPATIEKVHILIEKDSKDFPITGLKVTSVIYLDKIATIRKNLIIGELGEISKRLKRKINKNFKRGYRF
ncbi:MAG: type II toxin-antitoxin system PemK/MazF family toxin [Promethearchaeota archaeon]